VGEADLVIVTQEAKLLVNYLLHAWREVGRIRMAYWGHGAGFRRNRLSWITEWGKQGLASRVDWWFAYTEKSARALSAAGVARSRITVVNNAIDTRSLVAARRAISDEDLETWRARLGVRSENVGVFVGGMYKEKRLDFLLQSCRRIREAVGDFEVIFVGDGPEADRVRVEAGVEPWIHYLGPLFGEDKVGPLALGTVLLMPGLVGLAILDSFALEVPLVTTSVPYHSPEIDYLDDGVNGVVVPMSAGVDGYAGAVASLLSEPGRLTRLREGCRVSAGEYSVEHMAERFAGGVLAALAAR
jgi:glycosyltransferase involved in cell wall biosynthesis